MPFNMIEGGAVTALRLLRLMRVVKLLHAFPALQSVTSSLLLALKNIGYVMLMIMLINLVFALIGAMLFGHNDPMHFAHIMNAIATIWMIETMDSWEEILYINMFSCKNYGYYDLHGYEALARSC